jgi:hypothetical protein
MTSPILNVSQLNRSPARAFRGILGRANIEEDNAEYHVHALPDSHGKQRPRQSNHPQLQLVNVRNWPGTRANRRIERIKTQYQRNGSIVQKECDSCVHLDKLSMSSTRQSVDVDMGANGGHFARPKPLDSAKLTLFLRSAFWPPTFNPKVNFLNRHLVLSFFMI